SYTAPDGTIYTTSGTKTAVIPNAAGCDSTITINLTVNTVDISITQADLMITANAAGASYQWLDCNNSYVIISGEINQNFTANINGDYAVEITQNGCIDTSLCVNITGLGLGDFPLGNGILLYPNPTDGSYNIDFERELKNIQILVRDITGKLIEEYNYKNTKNINLYMGGSKGLYIIEIISPSERKVFRLVKQ
ncbi:MAG: T9SS type A sorting domain-containing protein, partial [Bacteroidales bacterium]|nr:T9SS type A sorting domain-containing protein [Bacteroidales bacterium]